MRREQGSGSVLALGGIALILTLLVATLTVGGAVAAAQRAATAADLAALAGAQQLRTGASSDSACARAHQVATANGAHLRSCSVTAGVRGEVAVVAAVPVPGWASGLGPATARARAGVVSSVVSRVAEPGD